MKKILLIISIALFVATSCDNYLDRTTLNSYDESNFWISEVTIRMYAQGAYMAYFSGYGNGFGTGNWGPGYCLDSDEYVNTTQWPTTTAVAGNGWSFSWVRRHNLMLDRVQNSTTIDDEAKNHWVGIARFFRALEYSNLCFTFGDMPYFDQEVFGMGPDVMYKDRDPMGYCVTKIIEDYDYAAANVRLNDGDGQINRDVVMAYMVRTLLQLGTLLKYHNIDQSVATQALTRARWAAEELINSGRYQIADDYRGMFTTLNTLKGNPEVIFYREYANGLANHCIVSYMFVGDQAGTSRVGQAGTTLKLINSYLTTDGLPVKQSLSYNYSAGKYYADMVQNRDPRLLASFSDTLRVYGVTGGGVCFSSTGIASVKFVPVDASPLDIIYTNRNNITSCPIIRFGEVLVSYAEVMEELGQFTQAVADATINRLRNRNIRHQGVPLAKLPAMVVSGSTISANGVVIDDPDRDPTVSPVLWEIRRERLVELVNEGQRRPDLKRWKKLSYMKTVEDGGGLPLPTNMGAAFSLYHWGEEGVEALHRAFPNTGELWVFTPGDSTRVATYNLWQEANRRDWVEGDILYERQYFTSIPLDQMTLYKEMGYHLTQNPGWVQE